MLMYISYNSKQVPKRKPTYQINFLEYLQKLANHSSEEVQNLQRKFAAVNRDTDSCVVNQLFLRQVFKFN